MTPEHREAKRRINASIARWKHLKPPGWDLRHVFVEGSLEIGKNDTIAETDAHWEYHQACIRWSLSAAAASEEKYLDACVVHEMVHVLLSGIENHLRTDTEDNSSYVNAVCEHTVETVTRAIMRVTS